MSRLRILKNPLDGGDEVLRVRTDDVLTVFKEVKKKHPQARIYISPACVQNDVTPTNKVDEASLQMLSKKHDFDIVCQAGEPVTIIAIVSLVISLAFAVYTLLTMPEAQNEGIDSNSANNSLNNRSNKQRIGYRVPDIFGTVKSIPDLISAPFRYYVDNNEIEESLLCVGRGYYEVSQVKDGDTLISDIAGSSVSIYEPNTSLIGTPQYRIGDLFTDAPIVATKLNVINGQMLQPPNSTHIATSKVYLEYPNKIKVRSGETLDFAKYWLSGERVVIKNAIFGADSFDGEYVVATSGNGEMTLSSPNLINPKWDALVNYTNQNTSASVINITLDGSAENWIGWFNLTSNPIDGFSVNFVAPQGLFSVSGKGGKFKRNVSLEMQYQELDQTGSPIGSATTVSIIMVSPNTLADPVGKTVKTNFSAKSRYRVRFRRITATPANEFDGDQFFLDVKVRDLYGFTSLEKLIYDDVTLVRSRTIATAGAMAVKDRQLNMIATRKVYSYSAGVKSADRVATNNFAEIVCAMTEDLYIGRRSVDTLDISSLYATQAEIQAYFGTSKATEFNYTLDNAKQSYEETLAQVASMVFCNARRDSGKIYFQFERTNPSSSILFNHRNKSPGSETRTEKFGVDNEYDGVEVKWIDPSDSWTEKTLKLPNENIGNPKALELKGVTNQYQAHFLAHRAWNKILYSRETVQFTAYGEADLVTINDRIAVTDDTMPTLVPLGDGFTSGEIVSWVGQLIETSQPVSLDPLKTYAIHLQLRNESVEVMQVTQGADEYHLVLERLPILPLITIFDGRITATTYSITLDAERDNEAYLVSEKSASGRFETQITAINYDPRYYSNDTDFINNLI